MILDAHGRRMQRAIGFGRTMRFEDRQISNRKLVDLIGFTLEEADEDDSDETDQLGRKISQTPNE